MRNRNGLMLLVLLALAAATACASGTADGAPRRRANVITEQEVAESNTITAFDAIRRLRSAWLSPRAGMEDAVVHLDGVRLNGISDLRNIPASPLRELTYMTGPDATTRYGTGYRGGLIDLRSKGTRGGG